MKHIFALIFTLLTSVCSGYDFEKQTDSLDSLHSWQMCDFSRDLIIVGEKHWQSDTTAKYLLHIIKQCSASQRQEFVIFLEAGPSTAFFAQQFHKTGDINLLTMSPIMMELAPFLIGVRELRSTSTFHFVGIDIETKHEINQVRTFIRNAIPNSVNTQCLIDLKRAKTKRKIEKTAKKIEDEGLDGLKKAEPLLFADTVTSAFLLEEISILAQYGFLRSGRSRIEKELRDEQMAIAILNHYKPGPLYLLSVGRAHITPSSARNCSTLIDKLKPIPRSNILIVGILYESYGKDVFWKNQIFDSPQGFQELTNQGVFDCFLGW